jgi:spoIIIJ-associated protein
MRGEARVRARVRPTRPRPKVDRRDRRRRRSGRGSDGPADERDTEPAPPATADSTAGPARGTSGEPSAATRAARTRRRGRRGSGRSGSQDAAAAEIEQTPTEEAEVGSDLSPSEQAAIVHEFLDDLVRAFGLEGRVSDATVDEETLEVRVDGDDLGLLIGPRGQTLQAVQELSRAAVQRRLAGGREARVRVDVAGYRQRRREALERFARQVADDVLATGTVRALEPMSAVDRKIVHDTVNEIDGVRTISEGEEPRRRVVVAPADAEEDAGPEPAPAAEPVPVAGSGDQDEPGDPDAAEAGASADPAGA